MRKLTKTILKRDTDDRYSTFRRRSPEDGGHFIRLAKNDIDYQWIVPYSQLLLKTFKTHINLGFFNYITAIKYICNHNKGKDSTTFVVDGQTIHYDISKYQRAHYKNSNETATRLLRFPIHKHYPGVVQLQVHLKNGERILYDKISA